MVRFHTESFHKFTCGKHLLDTVSLKVRSTHLQWLPNSSMPWFTSSCLQSCKVREIQSSCNIRHFLSMCSSGLRIFSNHCGDEPCSFSTAVYPSIFTFLSLSLHHWSTTTPMWPPTWASTIAQLCLFDGQMIYDSHIKFPFLITQCAPSHSPKSLCCTVRHLL